MKWLTKLLAVTVLGVFLNGCIEMRTLITVNKDGSGLVEENIFLGKEIINMFKEFASAFGDSTQPQQDFNMFEEDKIKAKTTFIFISCLYPLINISYYGITFIFSANTIIYYFTKLKQNEKHYPGFRIKAKTKAAKRCRH